MAPKPIRRQSDDITDVGTQRLMVDDATDPSVIRPDSLLPDPALSDPTLADPTDSDVGAPVTSATDQGECQHLMSTLVGHDRNGNEIYKCDSCGQKVTVPYEYDDQGEPEGLRDFHW